MKKLIALLLVCLMVLGVAACSPTAGGNVVNNPAEVRRNDGVNRICFALADISGQAVQTESSAFEATAKKLGFDEVIMLSAENSVETQISQIRDMITSECDVIVIYSVDADGIVPAVQSSNEAGIPVIAVDRGINGGEVLSTIASNNISDGRDVANYFGTLTAGEPEKSVKALHIIGNLSSTAQKERADGFRNGVDSWGQLTIVSEVATEADADKIYNAVVDAFKTNPDIKAIFVPYDALLSPVVSALKEIGKYYLTSDERHVMLGSVDGATEQLEWLSQDINDISISLGFEDFGSKAAEVAWAWLQGNNVPETVQTVSIPCIKGNVEYLAKNGYLWGLSQ